MSKIQCKPFFFTFGADHPCAGYFLIIRKENEMKAREEMMKHFGGNWSSCYNENEWNISTTKGTIADKYNLKRL